MDKRRVISRLFFTHDTTGCFSSIDLIVEVARADLVHGVHLLRLARRPRHSPRTHPKRSDASSNGGGHDFTYGQLFNQFVWPCIFRILPYLCIPPKLQMTYLRAAKDNMRSYKFIKMVI
jgi:hypothetical protein